MPGWLYKNYFCLERVGNKNLYPSFALHAFKINRWFLSKTYVCLYLSVIYSAGRVGCHERANGQNCRAEKTITRTRDGREITSTAKRGLYAQNEMCCYCQDSPRIMRTHYKNWKLLLQRKTARWESACHVTIMWFILCCRMKRLCFNRGKSLRICSNDKKRYVWLLVRIL